MAGVGEKQLLLLRVAENVGDGAGDGYPGGEQAHRGAAVAFGAGGQRDAHTLLRVINAHGLDHQQPFKLPEVGVYARAAAEGQQHTYYNKKR